MRPFQDHGRGTKPSEMRRGRPGLPYVVLHVLLYGLNSSVQWQGYGKCHINTTKLAKTLRVQNSYLIRAFHYMKQHRMLLELTVSRGSISCQVAPPWCRGSPGSQVRCWASSGIDNLPENVQDDDQDLIDN